MEIKEGMDCVEILLDRESDYAMPHDMVVSLMSIKAQMLYTYDPTFFDFDLLKQGYDVVVWRNGKYIVMSDLLDEEKVKKYKLGREIRPAHNLCKMLLAGVFDDYFAPEGE